MTDDFEDKWNALTVQINRVGITVATEILRSHTADPEVPEAIKDLLDGVTNAQQLKCILEAYRRGLEANRQEVKDRYDK